MGTSLQDQLLKMGLVDSSQVKKAQHEKRVKKHGQGRGADARAQKNRDARAKAQREATRQADRARAKVQRTAAEAREVQLQIQQIIASGKVQGRVQGRRRFYFETRDDRVPFLEVSDEIIAGLESGRIGLTEAPTGEVVLVEKDAAARIFELDADWLRVWNS